MADRSVYELLVEGSSVCGWKFTRRSILFESRAEAEAYMPEFKRVCMNRDRFDYILDDENFEMKIVERTLRTADNG